MPGICPHCGKVSNEEDPRFCSGCGARMDGGSRQDTRDIRPRSRSRKAR